MLQSLRKGGTIAAWSSAAMLARSAQGSPAAQDQIKCRCVESLLTIYRNAIAGSRGVRLYRAERD